MKVLMDRKKIIVFLVGLLILGLIFLISLGIIFAGRENKFDQGVQEKLDVEIEEEEENLDETIEDEIEEYIEEDIASLDINIKDDEDNEEDDGDQGETEAVSVLPFEPKNYAQNELRVGFLTDLHAKSNSGENRGDRVIKKFFKDCISRFVEEMNNEFFPDFLVLNGDVIEGTNRDQEVGSGELRSIKKLFDQTVIPKYWVVGNHDLRAVNKYFWKKSLGINYLTKAFDVRDYRIIIMDSNFDKKGNDIEPGEFYTRGCVSKKEIKWLKEKLKTDRKKIVFIHHPPLWEVDLSSNSGLPFNALELQKVFRENGVTAVFSGHIEDFYYDKIDGVKYFVIPGAVKNEKYQGTFAEIEFRDDKVEMNVSYIGKSGKYRKVNIKEILE